jgi:hypothetical protein
MADQRVAGFHRLLGRAPAGQRFGVAVDDADAVSADAGGEVPGQLPEERIPTARASRAIAPASAPKRSTRTGPPTP